MAAQSASPPVRRSLHTLTAIAIPRKRRALTLLTTYATIPHAGQFICRPTHGERASHNNNEN
jgi:hypothetical protein